MAQSKANINTNLWNAWGFLLRMHSIKLSLDYPVQKKHKTGISIKD